MQRPSRIGYEQVAPLSDRSRTTTVKIHIKKIDQKSNCAPGDCSAEQGVWFNSENRATFG